MSKKIPLEDVFEYNCPHLHCAYNYDYHCEYSIDISEFMIYKKGNDYADCNAFEVKEGCCENCGSKLKEHVERHPYGDTYAEEYLMMCPDCD